MMTTPPDGTSTEAELHRTTYIASAWFATAVISGTGTTAIMMSGGWRPVKLGPVPEALWLVGTGIASLGTVVLGWAGLPVTSRDAAARNRRRSLAVRAGGAAFLVGTAIASGVELVTD